MDRYFLSPLRFLAITLFLATSFASGNLLAQTEQPAATPEVMVKVLGKDITVKDKDQLGGRTLSVLLEQFAKDNQIEPTEAELDAFALKLEETEKQFQTRQEDRKKKLVAELSATNLSESDRKEKESQLKSTERALNAIRQGQGEAQGREEQVRAARRQIGKQFVKRWKINKALYAKYGGRVIFQQAGMEPLDAYRDFLKEQEKKGAFQILNKQYEADFWRYFTDDTMHRFVPQDKAAAFIETPWWLMKEEPKD